MNTAFVDEIALALDHLGIDVSGALDAAETKPFGFKRFHLALELVAVVFQSTRTFSSENLPLRDSIIGS